MDAAKLNDIARQAERDANTYNSKTGAARRTGLDDDAGVNTAAEQKFPGAKVVYGEGLTEQAYGTEHPHKKAPSAEQAQGMPPRGAAPPTASGSGGARGDIASQGKAAELSNVGRNPPGVGGSAFRGENYFTPEDVPDSTAALGQVPPKSVTQASREAEGYGRE